MLLSYCPVCEGEMTISRMTCGACGTQIDTEIAPPPFFRLPGDLQEFVMVFLRNRGNIREVEKELGISYPTVCKKIDQVNNLLGNVSCKTDRMEILERLERGEISAREAAKLLRER
ncbi:MAG: DUF2089 domain-containing protein [Candidatus Omnitrophica bacterium]|nr:DUF2089 domain-containing protein [Candidatus Omnitrophota bacterium]